MSDRAWVYDIREARAKIASLEALLRELRDRCEESGMGMVGIGHRIQVALGERAPDSASVEGEK